MSNEETKDRSGGWRWAAIILTGLMVLLITCVLSSFWGGILGYALGRGSARHVQVPEYYYREPFTPPAQPMPEMPDMPWEFEPGAWLGVSFVMTPEGAQITQVVSGSPAEAVGIQRGDVITEVEGRAVTEALPLDAHVRQYRPGDRVEIDLLRDGRSRTVTVRLGSRIQGELPWQPDDLRLQLPIPPNWQG
jgi:S1-C subfamily serine protease